jgi:hypothetical protein
LYDIQIKYIITPVAIVAAKYCRQLSLAVNSGDCRRKHSGIICIYDLSLGDCRWKLVFLIYRSDLSLAIVAGNLSL